MRVTLFILSALMLFPLLPAATTAEEALDCKRVARHAQLIMTIRQMDGDINEAVERVTKEGWPFGREMILEAYELPILPAEERKTSLTTPSESFANEWGRRCLAGELG